MKTDKFTETIELLADHFLDGLSNSIKPNFPKVTILIGETTARLYAEIPGFDKSDLTVNVGADNVLSIKGKRPFGNIVPNSKDKVFCKEIEEKLNFTRKFRLSKEFDISQITSKFTNSILEITIPKADSQKNDVIDVKIG